MLYPLKFKPVIKYKIWGGDRLKYIYPSDEKIGEVWCISDVDGDESIVENGFFREQALRSLIRKYKEKLVGEVIYLKYGNRFPLLFKLIDANDNLSIQVHPDDFNAKKVFGDNAVGKNELWYVLEANDSFIYAGFSQLVSKEQYLESVNNSNVELLLNKISVTKGDLFYIPSGTIHGVGARNLILEIQQSSDITYRIFDYNRRNDLGQLRELHTDKALGAINFEYIVNCKQGICFDGKLQQVISTKNFDIYSLFLDSEYVFNIFDTCFILTCVDGAFSYSYKNEVGEVMYMESLLVPASCVEWFIVKSNKAKVLITIPK